MQEISYTNELKIRKGRDKEHNKHLIRSRNLLCKVPEGDLTSQGF